MEAIGQVHVSSTVAVSEELDIGQRKGVHGVKTPGHTQTQWGLRLILYLPTIDHAPQISALRKQREVTCWRPLVTRRVPTEVLMGASPLLLVGRTLVPMATMTCKLSALNHIHPAAHTAQAR